MLRFLKRLLASGLHQAAEPAVRAAQTPLDAAALPAQITIDLPCDPPGERSAAKCCTLRLQGETLALHFASCEELHNGLDDLTGCTYQLSDRCYTDVATFHHETLEKLDESVTLCRDAHGSPVLAVYTSLPTFDSGDRRWDSQRTEYLCFDGCCINLVVCRRGYQIGSIKIFRRLLSAPPALKPWLARLGFPDTAVQWTEE